MLLWIFNLVGFNVSVEGKDFYEVTTSTYDEAKNEEEAVDVAYEKLKPTIDEKIESIQDNSSLLGKVYQPK